MVVSADGAKLFNIANFHTPPACGEQSFSLVAQLVVALCLCSLPDTCPGICLSTFALKIPFLLLGSIVLSPPQHKWWLSADGADPQLHFTAIKTAWGISGIVRSIGGSPLAGVLVEAVGAPGSPSAKGVTGEDGGYRVGGLKPGSMRCE